jgi:hypothetical protein
MHEANRPDEAENAIRTQLRRWTRRIISTVAADLTLNNVMMTIADKEEDHSFV